MVTKAQKAEQAAAVEYLRAMLPPGSKVHTIERHVSRSGMLRIVDAFIVGELDELVPIGRHAAKAMGSVYDCRREGIKVHGCGFNAAFDVVHRLGYALYPDGFGCVGPTCPSNDHSNGDRDYTPGHRHTSGGYAFKLREM